MPKEYISSQSCACCSSTLNKSQKKLVREVSSSGMMNKINNFLNKKIVKIGDLICNSCKCKIYRTSKKLSNQNSQIESMIFNDTYLEENFDEETEQMFEEPSFSNLNNSIQTEQDSSNLNCVTGPADVVENLNSDLFKETDKKLENSSDVNEFNQRARENPTIQINQESRRLLIENNKSILLDIPRTTSSHRQCFICKKYAKRKLHRVTNSTIVDRYVCSNQHINSFWIKML